MKIAVIGRGKIGRTLTERWIAAGHEVAVGLREPADSIPSVVASGEV